MADRGMDEEEYFAGDASKSSRWLSMHGATRFYELRCKTRVAITEAGAVFVSPSESSTLERKGLPFTEEDLKTRLANVPTTTVHPL